MKERKYFSRFKERFSSEVSDDRTYVHAGCVLGNARHWRGRRVEKQRMRNEGWNKVHDNGDDGGDGEAEEVSERTRWNDPADRIVSAYMSLAEGNICVMACESYVTQERTSTPSLSLSLLSSCPSCPFLGVCSLLELLCLSCSRGVRRSPLARCHRRNKRRTAGRISSSCTPSLRVLVGRSDFEGNARTR